MNAHKFVAERGIERARDVVELAPENSNYRYYSVDIGNSNSGWHVDYRANCIDLKELKQVVESLDTINQLCGLDPAKHTMVIAKEIGFTSDYEQIKQAIADHELVESFKKSTLVEYLDECEQVVNSWPKWKKESMQNAFGFGGKNKKCEVLDMVDISPNCEVRNG